MTNGFARSPTDVSPRESRARIARRVGSASAAKTTSSSRPVRGCGSGAMAPKIRLAYLTVKLNTLRDNAPREPPTGSVQTVGMSGGERAHRHRVAERFGGQNAVLPAPPNVAAHDVDRARLEVLHDEGFGV